MNGATDKHIDLYMANRDPHLRILDTFCIKQKYSKEVNRWDQAITIVLQSVEMSYSRRAHLYFEGVQQLEIDWPRWSVIDVKSISITSIRDRQWEGLNYRVSDLEEDMFSFICRAFAAEVLDAS